MATNPDSEKKPELSSFHPTGWQKFLAHLSRFMLHGLVFLPIVVIAFLAISEGVEYGNVLLFCLFTATSVSMEICWSCVLKKFELVQTLGCMARNATNPSTKTQCESQLFDARSGFSWYLILTASTVVGWMLVATCEVKHMTGKHPDEFLLKLTGVFSAFNLAAALVKLWITTSEDSRPTP